jgi:hypothetical protein
LKEIQHIKKEDWTPTAEHGIRRLILSMKEVSKRADGYTRDFEKLLKRYGKKKAA